MDIPTSSSLPPTITHLPQAHFPTPRRGYHTHEAPQHSNTHMGPVTLLHTHGPRNTPTHTWTPQHFYTHTWTPQHSYTHTWTPQHSSFHMGPATLERLYAVRQGSWMGREVRTLTHTRDLLRLWFVSNVY